jgi:hypothetical protein
MSLLLFEGAAGTGKTTKLLEEARHHIAASPLGPEQRVLALTKVHGSRRRMEAKLKGRGALGHSVDCVTIDSFAWRLLRRWRGLLRDLGIDRPVQGDFASVTSAAGQLLRHPGVGPWVTRLYPLVVVDELQDCKGGELDILNNLTSEATFLCAGDAFQDLSGAAGNEAMSWAEAKGQVIPLTDVQRTRVKGLRSAATAIRNGETLQLEGSPGFQIVRVPTAPLGGAIANWRIRSWQRFGQVVIISPSKSETSPFVRNIVSWVSSNSAKSSKNTATAGPYPVEWEPGEDGASEELLGALNLPEELDVLVSSAELAVRAERAGAPDFGDWVHKQRNVAGRESVSVREVIDQVKQLVHRRRAFGRPGERARVAMTVHQAKNREFESVIVLWPLRMVTDPESQRRMLYNAITRAKRQALVIVEDPVGNRLSTRPFVGGQ